MINLQKWLTCLFKKGKQDCTFIYYKQLDDPLQFKITYTNIVLLLKSCFDVAIGFKW